MVATPLLPDRSTQTACRMENSVSGFGARTFILPQLGVLARWDNGVCTTARNGFVASFRIIGAVPADACDGFAQADLFQQTGHHGCIASGVVGYFDGPDFQRGGINAQVDLAPLAAIVSPMLFGLSLAFAQHLDASAIDKKV